MLFMHLKTMIVSNEMTFLADYSTLVVSDQKERNGFIVSKM